jgi:hypothetical protein
MGAPEPTWLLPENAISALITVLTGFDRKNRQNAGRKRSGTLSGSSKGCDTL